MTTATREQIFAALFDLADGLTWIGADGDAQTLTKMERRIRDWQQVQKPWMGQLELRENFAQITRLPFKRTFRAQWWFYIDEGMDQNVIPATSVNNLLDAVEALFTPSPRVAAPGFGGLPQTLGGLVHHAFIEGEVIKVGGDLEGAGLVTVPITLLAP